MSLPTFPSVESGSSVVSPHASVGLIPSVNRFRGKWFRDERKCERNNYVPNLTPANSSRGEWGAAYTVHLRHMMSIVAITIDEEYPKRKIKWDRNPQIEKNFSKVIYHCSSKYISPYLENYSLSDESSEDSPSKNVSDNDKWEKSL
jgi:hypothetical protein